MIKRALWQGLLAGTAGGVVMTLGEKIEQAEWRVGSSRPGGPGGDNGSRSFTVGRS